MSLDTTFVPVRKPESLQVIAYATIKRAILSLELKPGQALSNRQLAKELEISETPIRDALRDLEQEGFVVRVPHKGTFVTHVKKQQIEETFQIRAALEELAVRLSVSRFSQSDVTNVSDLLEKAKLALHEGQREQASSLGAEFHQYFIQRTGNQQLSAILSNLDDHHERFRRISDLIDGRLEKSQQEHSQIFEAVKSKVADAAGLQMRTHLESVLSDIQSSQQ